MREGYCTLMELTSEHPNPWASDPQLQRPAIIAALARDVKEGGSAAMKLEPLLEPAI